MGWHPLDLPLPAGVRAGYTTRDGGVSPSPWESFNLGDHCGDEPVRVEHNRQRLEAALGVPVQWLRQVHGCGVAARPLPEAVPEADAAWTDRPGRALAVLTADCLPALFWSLDGGWVGVAHAGWRGLAAGVLPALVRAAPVPPACLQAWLGPAIGPAAFEVDAPVRQAFAHWPRGWEQAFRPNRPGHWLLDLQALARLQLHRLGLETVHAEPACTFSEKARFFSYRRDGRTGRQAALIWLR